jgi:amino acid adenylation domain-containing protein
VSVTVDGSRSTQPHGGGMEMPMEAPVFEGYRLSPQQRRLWQVQEGRGVFFSQIAIRIEGKLCRETLARALDEIVARHEILRTIYRGTAGIPFPVQTILDAAAAELEDVDLRGLTAVQQDARIADLLAGHRCREVDLEAAPVLLLCLARLADERHDLLVSVPSLGADARTLRNLMQQIAASYHRQVSGAEGEDSLELVQYLQFSEWQLQLLEDEGAASGASVWHRMSSGAAALPFENEGEPAGWAREPAVRRVALSPEHEAAVASLALARGVPLSTVLLAGWQALLARLTASREIVVAVPFEGRKYSELRDSCGRFSKWLPLRLELDPRLRFDEMLARVQAGLEEAESWQEYFLAPDGDIARMGFVFTEWPAGTVGGNLAFAAEQLRVEDEPLRLTLSCRLLGGGLELSLAYDPETFTPAAAAYLAARCESLLADALEHPAKPIGDLDLLGADEQRRLLAEWGRGETGTRWQEPIHRTLARQAERTPAALAVVCGEQTLTYSELDARANQLARHLRRLGVGAGSLVPIWLPRSPAMVVALLGVLKAGAAYVPLDPVQPSERLARILNAIEPPLIVTQSDFIAAAAGGGRFLLLDADAERLAAESRLDPEVPVPLDGLAYVLYTSGSTGVPKGVMIPHRGLANYLGWCVEAYAVAAGGGAGVHSPLGFDLTVTSLLSPLLCGGRAVLGPEDGGIESMAAAIAGAEVALFKLTPSHLDAVAELLHGAEIRDRPRLFIVGGERLAAATLASWWQRDPRTRIVNEYGPTETVVGCCISFLQPGEREAAPVPIGRPIANTRAYVLDALGRPVAAGIKGELHIAGEGLARGYLGLPDLTAAKFIPDPFSGAAGARLYRTGDLVRWRLDGDLEFIGRLDAQIKVRGHRVEPAEVELALERHPGIADAIVLAQGERGQGDRLAAYFVAAGGLPPSGGELRAFLQREVPEYMIPSVFAPLAAFPLTANGKVDQEALRIQVAGRPVAETAYVAPETELERTLAAIWTEVLRVERVGLYDNFFDLGGHSLLMVQVFSRIKAQLETELLMVELFEFPTVSSMAKRLAQEREPAALPALSPGRAEARLASLSQLDEDDPAAARIDYRRSLENV